MSRLDEVFAELPDRLTVEQLSQLLGIEMQTTYRWLQEGRVPAYKVGRAWVIFRDEVKDMLEASSNQKPRIDPDPTQSEAPAEPTA